MNSTQNQKDANARSFPLKFEFYGIPRLRVGVAEFFVDLPENDRRLETAINLLRSELPPFDRYCIVKGQLRSEFILNISGKQFTRSPDHELTTGDSVLILSSDAGG